MALVGPPPYFPLGFNQLTLAVPIFQLNPSYFATTPVSQSIISLLSEFKAAAVSYHFNRNWCDPLLSCLPPVFISFGAQGSSHCAHQKPFSTSHPSRSKTTISPHTCLVRYGRCVTDLCIPSRHTRHALASSTERARVERSINESLSPSIWEERNQQQQQPIKCISKGETCQEGWRSEMKRLSPGDTKLYLTHLDKTRRASTQLLYVTS